jgi:hypothetical protein
VFPSDVLFVPCLIFTGRLQPCSDIRDKISLNVGPCQIFKPVSFFASGLNRRHYSRYKKMAETNTLAYLAGEEERFCSIDPWSDLSVI